MYCIVINQIVKSQQNSSQFSKGFRDFLREIEIDFSQKVTFFSNSRRNSFSRILQTPGYDLFHQFFLVLPADTFVCVLVSDHKAEIYLIYPTKLSQMLKLMLETWNHAALREHSFLWYLSFFFTRNGSMDAFLQHF